MPTTPNYEWVLPTEGGDAGVWDTKLNDAFESVDADMQALDDRLAIMEAAVLTEAVMVLASAGDGLGWTATALGTTGMLHSSGVGALVIPVPLRPGQRVNEVHIRGEDPSGTAEASLIYQATDGSTAGVGGSVTLPTSIGNVSVTGLTHDVLADKAYFVYVIPPASPNGTYVVHVRILVEATP